MFKKIISATAVLAFGMSSAAFAMATGNAANISRVDLPVDANVSANCSFVPLGSPISGASVNGFQFGDITAQEGGQASTTASLSYTCNGLNANPKIALSDVNGVPNTPTFRLLNATTTDPSRNKIDYAISQVGGGAFNDDNTGFQPVATNPITLLATIKQVPTTLPAGAYSDVVHVDIQP